jgi:hypothetical protein
MIKIRGNMNNIENKKEMVNRSTHYGDDLRDSLII